MTNKEDFTINKKSAHLRHSIYYEKLLFSANTLLKDGGEKLTLGLKLFDINSANIVAGQRWSQNYQNEDTERIKLCISYPISGARIFELRQSPSIRISWIESSLKAARKVKDLLSVSKDLGLLGAAYITISDYQSAKNMFVQQKRISKRINNYRDEVAALNNLGIVYKNLGRFRQAIECYEKSKEIFKEHENVRDYANALMNIGNIYTMIGNMKEQFRIMRRC